MRLQPRHKFFQSYTCLLDHAFESAELERFVLWQNDGPIVLAKHQMGTRLAKLHKTETFQRTNGLHAADVTGDCHATARTGSCTKWRRTLPGRCFGSK